MTNDQAYELLCTGKVDEFNAYRREHQHQELDFSKGDLGGLNLSGVNLSGTDFIETCLEAAHLYGANLSNADFVGASISDADMREANLSGARNLATTRHFGVRLEGAIGVPLNFAKAVMHLTLLSLQPATE